MSLHVLPAVCLLCILYCVVYNMLACLNDKGVLPVAGVRLPLFFWPPATCCICWPQQTTLGCCESCPRIGRCNSINAFQQLLKLPYLLRVLLHCTCAKAGFLDTPLPLFSLLVSKSASIPAKVTARHINKLAVVNEREGERQGQEIRQQNTHNETSRDASSKSRWLTGRLSTKH